MTCNIFEDIFTHIQCFLSNSDSSWFSKLINLLPSVFILMKVCSKHLWNQSVQEKMKCCWLLQVNLNHEKITSDDRLISRLMRWILSFLFHLSSSILSSFRLQLIAYCVFELMAICNILLSKITGLIPANSIFVSVLVYTVMSTYQGKFSQNITKNIISPIFHKL